MPEQRVQPELTQSQIELEARDKRRLETFIDAVFAIAITLLGLGLVVPIVQHSNEVLSASLVSMGPKFIGYFLAFALLGILLNSHWRQFQNIVYADWCCTLSTSFSSRSSCLSHLQRQYGLLSRYYCRCTVFPLRHVHHGAHSLHKLIVRETP
jgi:flagellar biosynthesis protein FliQ